MNKWTPCKRIDFIRKLRGLGFEGVFSGGKHQYMVFGKARLTIPTNDEYSVPQLKMMLREVSQIIQRDISLEEWNTLK
jgi:hypothetical protein